MISIAETKHSMSHAYFVVRRPCPSATITAAKLHVVDVDPAVVLEKEVPSR
jgi:hypothetical protein